MVHYSVEGDPWAGGCKGRLGSVREGLQAVKHHVFTLGPTGDHRETAVSRQQPDQSCALEMYIQQPHGRRTGMRAQAGGKNIVRKQC